MSGKPWEIIHGDVRRICKTLPANHFDAVLCDPPYGLSFMGRRWDYSVPSAMVWQEVERVLKPGAHAMIFGGSRTFHRLVCAVEDGGFEVRDLLMWLYGSGYPKSFDVSKGVDDALGHVREVTGTAPALWESWEQNAGGKGTPRSGLRRDKAASPEAERWKGYGTALKPSYEPVLLARKLPEGSIAENALEYGVGGIAIDACRLGRDQGAKPDASGRWPANVILDEETGALLDEQSGDRPGMSGGGRHRKDYEGGMFGAIDSTHTARGDRGGASRFFYTAKADRYQREAGLGDLKKRTRAENTLRKEGSAGSQHARAGAGSKEGAANIHPTVKPIDLIRYLATLILPPKRDTPRRILVPFAGVSSEMIGCIQAGWDEVVGIEREAEYVKIARERITKGGVLSGLMDRSLRKR